MYGTTSISSSSSSMMCISATKYNSSYMPFTARRNCSQKAKTKLLLLTYFQCHVGFFMFVPAGQSVAQCCLVPLMCAFRRLFGPIVVARLSCIVCFLSGASPRLSVVVVALQHSRFSFHNFQRALKCNRPDPIMTLYPLSAISMCGSSCQRTNACLMSSKLQTSANQNGENFSQEEP